MQAAQLAALEEEVLRNVEEAVKKKVEEVMSSEDVQRRIQVRSTRSTKVLQVEMWRVMSR